MARYTGPQWKISRRLGFSILENGKELNRRAYAPGQHGQKRKKQTEYGLQLAEKQKVRHMYGVNEKQFHNTFNQAGKMEGIHGYNFLCLLERRLDNVVYRLGFASTRRQARQLVNHGHFLVNGVKTDIPSYRVNVGDVIEVRERSLNLAVIKEALEKDYFCKRADGPYMKGKVWPGECNFPDYTNPAVREWWAGLFKELISEIGVKGVWNDMNEPAVMEVPGKTFPPDVRHDYDGNPCSHRKAHNIYGTQMARATYEGVKRFAYPKRPFIITRSAYSGAQRYTSSWTGDNVASWEHLWIANIQMQRMSMSGMGFTGSDIGGFAEQPSGELYARWIQLGVFHPFCRTHSSGDHGEQEPWSFGTEVIDITRKFVELRYQLLPYLYTMFWNYVNDGTPMLKPLVYFDQEDMHTHYRTDEFIFGNQILVCPILEPNAQGRRMYLPKGNWYNY